LRESEDGFGAFRTREAKGVGAFATMQSDKEAIIQFSFFLHLSVNTSLREGRENTNFVL